VSGTDRIGSGFDRLHQAASADTRRHDVEFHRRRDVIELWMPV
jgi:hypothetical protein